MRVVSAITAFGLAGCAVHSAGFTPHMDTALMQCNLAAGDSLIAEVAARQGGQPTGTELFREVKLDELPTVPRGDTDANEVVEFNFVVQKNWRVDPCTIRAVAQSSDRFVRYGGELLLNLRFIPFDSLTPPLPAFVRQRVRVVIQKAR